MRCVYLDQNIQGKRIHVVSKQDTPRNFDPNFSFFSAWKWHRPRTLSDRLSWRNSWKGKIYFHCDENIFQYAYFNRRICFYLIVKWSHEAAVDIHSCDFQKRNCKTPTVMLNKKTKFHSKQVCFHSRNFFSGGGGGGRNLLPVKKTI